MEKKGGKMMENILMTIFQRRNSTTAESDSSPSNKPLPFLSPSANSVLSRCSKILNLSTQELHSIFDTKINVDIDKLQQQQQQITYGRSLLEFCSYKALDLFTARPDYLSDKEFSRLTFDMMLAWEAPGQQADVEIDQSINNVTRGSESMINKGEIEDGDEEEDGWSLFYSSSTEMAVQVNNVNTVGPEAFARIAPSCAAVADVVTVDNLFHVLTNTSGNRLHFLIYDKYLQTLDRVIKSARSGLTTSSNLEILDGEFILDVDGAVPTQPVLQHMGISAWPGRLTLSNNALFFESLGVGQYEKPAKYDLSRDLKQVIKPELTGPLGARLFDKAVMYRSIITEPVFLEFPEFKGSSRRDYWLDIALEILCAHRFTRKFNLRGIQKSEAIARAILGIFRCRAVRDAFHFFSSHYKSLLIFNLAENLPGGDTILETLASCLLCLGANSAQIDISGSPFAEKHRTESPVSFLTLSVLGLIIEKDLVIDEGSTYFRGYIRVGETNRLEVAVKQSKMDTGKAEAAQHTVNQVKVDGIDANFVIMRELLFPLILLTKRLQILASWEEPFKSTVYLLLMCYMFVSGWIRFVVPSIIFCTALYMLWHRLVNKGKLVQAFRITAPPNRNAVEQLITLQEAISQVEALVQAVNIVLLKMRALLLAVLPQATYSIALLLLVISGVLMVVPFRYVIMSIVVEAYTREMPLRRESSYRWWRRVREWWFRIPAAPVQLIKHDHIRKNK